MHQISAAIFQFFRIDSIKTQLACIQNINMNLLCISIQHDYLYSYHRFFLKSTLPNAQKNQADEVRP